MSPTSTRHWSGKVRLAAFSAVAVTAVALAMNLAVSSAALAAPVHPQALAHQRGEAVPAPGPSVSNPGTQGGYAGVAVSLTMTAVGGTIPYTWSATGLPLGLVINASTGVIAGTPSSAASYTVTVTVVDAVGRVGATSFGWIIKCAAPGQKLVNPGFESGAVAWSQTVGVIGVNGPQQPARTGLWDAWLDGYGTTHTDTLSQAVTLPPGCTSYSFTYYLHIGTAQPGPTGYDTLTVAVLNPAGTVLATLATYSNLNAGVGYSLNSFSLAAFAGSTVILKFTGSEDAALQTSFVVDDTAVTVA